MMVDRGFDQWLDACKLGDYLRNTRYDLEILESGAITSPVRTEGLPQIGVTLALCSLKCHGGSRLI